MCVLEIGMSILMCVGLAKGPKEKKPSVSTMDQIQRLEEAMAAVKKQMDAQYGEGTYQGILDGNVKIVD